MQDLSTWVPFQVDILLKKRKQEAEHADAVDPECRIPVISMRDGSILQGDKAPKYKDLWEWLSTHPHYIVDQSAFTAPLSTVSAVSDTVKGNGELRRGDSALISCLFFHAWD